MLWDRLCFVDKTDFPACESGCQNRSVGPSPRAPSGARRKGFSDQRYLLRFAFALAGGAIGLLTASCSPKAAPETSWPGPSWSSDHFVFHARPDDASVDAGVLAYLEANGDLVARGVLGLAPTQWGPIQYFKYRDDADFAAGNPPCGGKPDTQGCCVYFSDGRIEIHSPLAVDPHELVHAYAKSLGVPPTFLVEGLAVSLSCDPSPEEVLGGLDGCPRYNFAQTTWTQCYQQFYPVANAGPEQYFAAGMITTWLVDHASMSGLLAVYKALPADASADDFAAAVLQATGIAMDDAWQAMGAAPARRACADVPACTALDPTSNTLDRSRAVSPVPSSGVVVKWTAVSALGAPPAVRACSASGGVSTDMAWPILELAANVGPASALFLPGNTGYVLTSGQREAGWDGGPAAPTDYAAADVPPGSLGATCSGLQPIAVDDSSVRIQIWPTQAPLVFAVDLKMSQNTTGSVNVGPAGDLSNMTATDFTVDVCSSCDSGALTGCTELTAASYFSGNLQRTGPLWFKVQWNAPFPNDLLNVGVQF